MSSSENKPIRREKNPRLIASALDRTGQNYSNATYGTTVVSVNGGSSESAGTPFLTDENAVKRPISSVSTP
jgi:hypothetical protein